MKFYLSSFKFGKKKAQLKSLAPRNEIAIIPNALDFRGADSERTKQSIDNKKMRLAEIGLAAEVLDLKDYFGKKNELGAKLDSIGAVFVMGGNVFILRQAMKLSGLDEMLTELHAKDTDFLYSGYSAAGCVLAPSLEPYKVVDDSTQTPYPEQSEVIWEGLGLVDFAFMPHWQSDHPESEAIEQRIQYCKDHDIKYKAIRDGEVLIFLVHTEYLKRLLRKFLLYYGFDEQT